MKLNRSSILIKYRYKYKECAVTSIFALDHKAKNRATNSFQRSHDTARSIMQENAKR
jgi:hypothetical protein